MCRVLKLPQLPVRFGATELRVSVSHGTGVWMPLKVGRGTQVHVEQQQVSGRRNRWSSTRARTLGRSTFCVRDSRAVGGFLQSSIRLDPASWMVVPPFVSNTVAFRRSLRSQIGSEADLEVLEILGENGDTRRLHDKNARGQSAELKDLE